MSDSVDQSYFPTAKMRLTVRFDEFDGKTKLTKQPPKPVRNLVGVKSERAALDVVPDPLHPGHMLLLPHGVTAPKVGTAVGANKDELTFEMVIIPKNAEWSQNGVRTADSLHASFRYIDCPIDPRLVRACAVEYYLGTISADDYYKGVSGARRDAFGEVAGEPINLIPDFREIGFGIKVPNSRFKGFVDKWSQDFSENGEPMISIECRDNTQLLIDEEVPPNVHLDETLPLDKSVAEYLSHFPCFAGLSVTYYPQGATAPKFKDALQGTAKVPQLSTTTPAKGGGAKTKLSVWDHLTDIVGALGHIIRVEGDVIILQTVRSYTNKAIVRRPDDPFKGRIINTDEGSVKIDYRRFIYGRNLEEMKISRNFSKSAPKNIEVRSYSADGKTTLMARFPEPEHRLQYVLPGDAKDQKWTVIKIGFGGINPKFLKVVAQSYYEAQGRNEMSIDLKTKNLASFGGGNLDPDILDMKAGDTFELHINRDDEETSSITRMEKVLTSQPKGAEILKQMGYSTDFADAYSKAYTDAGFLTNFRVKGMKVSWDTDTGVGISIQGVNYIEVRADVENSDAEKPAPPLPKVPGGGSPPAANAPSRAELSRESQ